MRWIVGDVHGCVFTFEKLLREIRFEPAFDELWSAGDLVNTGPASAETLRLWVDVGGKAVLGNHDVYALGVFSGVVERRKDELDALLAAPDAGRLFGTLRTQPLLKKLPGACGAPETWLVHAGIHPKWTDPAAELAPGVRGHDDAWLTSEAAAFATRARCCNEDGERVKFVGPPEECPDGFKPWDDFYRGEALVVHGHWARRGHYRRGRVIGLDSGCVYGGTLTAWSLEEDRVVQVSFRD